MARAIAEKMPSVEATTRFPVGMVACRNSLTLKGERQGVPRGARDFRLRPLGAVAVVVEPRELVRQGHVPQTLVDAQPLLRLVFGGAIEQVAGFLQRLDLLVQDPDQSRAVSAPGRAPGPAARRRWSLSGGPGGPLLGAA